MTRLMQLALALTLVAGTTRADVLYGTSLNYREFYRLDTVTNTATAFTTRPSQAPDSLIFDQQGRILYSAFNTGELHRFDPSNGTDVALPVTLSGSPLTFGHPVDLLMDPGGNSVLISNQSYSGSTVSFINRVDLSTNTVTTLAETPGNANGLAYDNTGRLFASIGNNTLAQLDPMTGSVIQSVNLGAGVSIDGLAFDSFTNRLYGSSFFDNSIIRFNPNNLSSHSLLMNGTQVASLNHPDGIVSNGRGDLYIVSRGVGGGNFTDTRLYDYNLIAGTLTASVAVAGLDDIAPLVGPGAIVPEPSSFLLLGLGLIGGLGIMKQRGRPE